MSIYQQKLQKNINRRRPESQANLCKYSEARLGLVGIRAQKRLHSSQGFHLTRQQLCDEETVYACICVASLTAHTIHIQPHPHFCTHKPTHKNVS